MKRKLTFQQELALKCAKEGHAKYMDFIRAGATSQSVTRLERLGFLNKLTNMEKGNTWDITEIGLRALRDGGY